MIYDVIIIGSGMAGLTAAIYSVRYDLKTLVLGKDLGMITEAPKVENWPGVRTIHGFELMQKVQEHAKDLGAEIKNEIVESIEKQKQFTIKTSNNKYESKALIIASGTKKRRLKLEDEARFMGKGLSYCATCDGPFFKDKDVAVVGAGNAALMSAYILSKTSSKVYLISRSNKLKAFPAWIDTINNTDNIEIIYNSNVMELIGEDHLEAIKTEDQEIETEGLFIEIGSTPSAELSKQLNLSLDDRNYIKTDAAQRTNKKGVFAAGDITTNSNKFRQLVTAAAEGAVAANSAFIFLKEDKDE